MEESTAFFSIYAICALTVCAALRTVSKDHVLTPIRSLRQSDEEATQNLIRKCSRKHGEELAKTMRQSKRTLDTQTDPQPMAR